MGRLGMPDSLARDAAHTLRRLADKIAIRMDRAVRLAVAKEAAVLAGGGREQFDPPVPDGKHGRAEVRSLTVDRSGSLKTLLVAAGNGGWRGYVAEGTYRALLIDGSVWMSTTTDELYDHLEFVATARGVVLVTGLGLGCVVSALCRRPDVTRVVVVESDADVVALVGPALLEAFGARLEIYHDDAFRFAPPFLFDAAWHDIWPVIAPENLVEMRRLRRHYRRHMRNGARQHCWAEADAIRPRPTAITGEV